MLGLLLVLCGYLLGSVPTGLLVGRAFGVDVLEVGSGNIGMANVLRAAGRWPAALTMLGDMLKGFVPVVLARAITDNGWIIAGVAMAAVIGAWRSPPATLRWRRSC
jgi:glycerol-3-phosphate acyltransferase PlsY